MKLEQELKMSKFKSEWHRAALNIIYTSYWLNDKVRGVLKPYGITAQQYNVLRILRGQHPSPISTSDIRERMLDRMPDTSRIVDRLHNQGLLERKTCKADKRLVDVCITEAGLKLLNEVDDLAGPNIDNNLNALTEDECRTLSELLDKARG
ncbi:MarR family transcriptional regulator [soil metagenome]